MSTVDVHILAKEDTDLGKRMFKASVENIAKSNYANNLIIIDNGCNIKLLDEVIEHYAVHAKGKYPILLHSNLTDFSALRNLALTHSRIHGVEYFHWIDTDECYPPEVLQRLKQIIDTQSPDAINNMFVHFMIEPDYWQDQFPKHNIFKITKDIRWELPVHEHVVGYGSNVVHTNLFYHHYGYIRPQWVQALKWIRYDLWHHGHANGYREYYDDHWKKVVDYYSDTRTPDQCLEDRWSYCTAFDGQHTQPFMDLIHTPWKVSGLSWNEWLASTNDFSVWQRWQEMREIKGSWKETIGWACNTIGLTEKL